MQKKKVATVNGGTSPARVIGYRTVGGKKIKVLEIPHKVKGGYIGLNRPAAREKGIPTNIKSDEVVVCRKLKKSTKKNTTHHEIIENYLMGKCGLPYKEAHAVGLRFEHTNKTPIECWQWYKNFKHKHQKHRTLSKH